MKRKFFTTTALLSIFAVCLAAVIADVSGKWTATLKTPDGNEFKLDYVFKLDGDKLSGTVSSPQGEIDISEGKVKGDSLFFTVPVNGMDIKNSGKFYAAADSIGLDVLFNDTKFHSTLKRPTDK
jgi:hypothetical protein